jgi:hypothetical protein
MCIELFTINMLCQYRFKNDTQCKNTVMGTLKYCHLLKHHKDRDRHNQEQERLHTLYKDSTQSVQDFEIYDVLGDGACLYRCFARLLLCTSKLKIDLESDYVDELLIMKKCLLIGYTEQSLKLKDINLNKYEEGNMAYLLQQIIREWIMENRDMKIEHLDCTLENYVKVCHEIGDIFEYNMLYKIFAGDKKTVKIDSGRVYQSGKNQGKPIFKNVAIRDRWGGAPELFAFTHIFGINIQIYTLKDFDINKCKVINCGLKNFNARCTLTEIFENDNNKYEFKLLLTDKQSGHYSCMMDK